MCYDDYAPLGAIVLSPWQAKVNANGLFLPGPDRAEHLVNKAMVNVMATIKFESWLEAERNNAESTINAMSAMQDGLPKLEVDYGECLKLLTPEGMKTWAHLPDPKTYAEAMSRPIYIPLW